MAGIMPLSGKSGRKQWTLHDGPKGSLRRLRSQLAQDGCPESQVVLAKQLLEETSDLDEDKEENAKLGVYWLTKASEQGNLEATDMLKKCLETGRGITEHNYYDVKSCLDMSQDEKVARRAAREMFTSLSNGEDFITSEQLQRRMRSLSASSSSRSKSSEVIGHVGNHSQKSLRDSLGDSLPETSEQSQEDERLEGSSRDWSDHPGEKISEAALVSAASNYANGMLPIVSRVLCLAEPGQLELDAVPLLQRPFVHPLSSFRRLYNWLIETLGHRAIPLRKLLFTSHIHILVLLILYPLLGTESIVLLVPTILYYLSSVVMVISTFQILQRRRELADLRVWSRLFLNYSGGNLNPEEAEYQFCRNNLKPYGHFFLALLVNLIVNPVLAHQWIPQSEMTIIAVVLTLTTLFNFAGKESKYPDLLVLFSFGVNVLAKYPYETDLVVNRTWRFLDMKFPTFASYVVGHGIEFCLNFRVVFYLLIPAVFAKMAARDGWRGTYKTLIPHCVTLSWWQIAVLNSQGATWYGLIRGALALVGMVLFLPIAGLASIVLPVVATAKYLSESDLAVTVAVTAVLGGLPFFASWYLRRCRAPRFNWIITFIQLSLGIAAAIFLFWPVLSTYRTSPSPFEVAPTLSWEQYQNYCHQPAWEESSSKAQVQVRCAHLEGISVTWEGYVTNVRLKSVGNNLDSVLSRLPDLLRSPMTCFLGETYQENCNMTDKLSKQKCRTVFEVQKRRQQCHLASWNRYEFEISVKMKSGMWGSNAEMILVADRSFENFSLNIYPGDKVWFSGTLLNEGLEGEAMLGGAEPHVQLEEVGCLACHVVDLEAYKKQRFRVDLNSVLQHVYLGIKTVLNFLLNPVVIFT